MKAKLLLLTLLMATTAMGQQHREILLRDGWQFSHDKQTWQNVTVPHDWAIAGPFDKKWDLQRVAITQNGETEASEKSGRSGSLPWIGQGYYKRTIDVPAEYVGQHVALVFDGAMAEARVSVNGHEVAYWPYGYNTFRANLSDYVHAGENLVEVSLQNVEESSRWYPGAGIYRPVTLAMMRNERIDPWQTFYRTDSIARGVAYVSATVGCKVPAGLKGLAVEVILRNHKGNIVAGSHGALKADGTVSCQFEVKKAQLWSPETPYLYKATATLMQYGRTLDQSTQTIGLRTVEVKKGSGFMLNGEPLKLKGVCLHHDLGPIGAAVNQAALVRQIKMMKEMGCNAIRTAHNMPSQLQMHLCDSLGMMVMAESFDMWRYAKCKNGYARFFDDWADRDIERLVVAHRNHPSIVMWSIGNEIPEQGMEGGREIAQRLQDICHRLDPTRPVTQGMDRIDDAIRTGFAQIMDIPGMNYRVHKYVQAIRQLPQGYLLGSETASTVSSRGVYKFPVEPDDNSRFSSWTKDYDPNAIKTADGQCSGYDVEYCPWSNLPDDDWAMQDDYPWLMGEFVWTGYDYLGEPSPYDEYWPSRSSYFGICDLAGLPKDRYYLYRSKWNTEKHTIHLLPHWSWGRALKQRRGQHAAATPFNRVGQVTPVYCYTDYPEGELFLNGKSQGRIKKNPKSRLDRYRLRWNDVRYEPGTLRVVVYDADGREAGSQELQTADKPARLKLDVWTQNAGSKLRADGDDLAFVTVSLTDEHGTLIPYAADQLQFSVSGAGSYRAACNGDATSLESFCQPTMRLFNGQLVVVVQSARERGTLTLTVSAPGLGLSQTADIAVE